jgi:hypothetical protein
MVHVRSDDEQDVDQVVRVGQYECEHDDSPFPAGPPERGARLSYYYPVPPHRATSSLSHLAR